MWGRHRSGELFPCEVTANQVSADLAEDEEILLVHVRDRSAEYYAEQALRNSEQRFRALFQRAINPILLMNAEGYYVDANGAALEFLDCTPEDLIGANVASFAPPTNSAAATHSAPCRPRSAPPRPSSSSMAESRPCFSTWCPWISAARP
jgi:PAS domain-containing protein